MHFGRVMMAQRLVRVLGCTSFVVAIATCTALPAMADPAPPAPAPAPAPGPAVSPPGFSARSWIVADASTGKVLAGHDEHARLPQASTLKLLTSLTLIPRLAMNAKYTGQPSDDAAEGAEVGVVPGGHYTIKDLFNGLLLRSGNDAASALANANGGFPQTVAQMNEVAAHLNARDTVAMTPSGLDAPGQVSSAFDLAIFMRASLRDPQLSRLLSHRKAQFPIAGEPAGSPGVIVETLDPLANSHYPGFLGGKTGYTSNASRTYVAAARQNGRTLIIAMMNYDMSTKKSATKLLNWGFANAASLPPTGAQLPEPGPSGAPPQPAIVQDSASNSLVSTTMAIPRSLVSIAKIGVIGFAAVLAGVLIMAIVWIATRSRTHT